MLVTENTSEVDLYGHTETFAFVSPRKINQELRKELFKYSTILLFNDRARFKKCIIISLSNCGRH